MWPDRFAAIQVAYATDKCKCGSGKSRNRCSACAEGPDFCEHSKYRQGCLICSPTDTGKTIHRGKTCLEHEKIRGCCKECREAEKEAQKTDSSVQFFFGKRERAALAAAKPL